MVAVLDRAPPVPPVAPPDAESLGYQCGCKGFRTKRPIDFCLRCLTIWVEGLPGVFQGKQLERQMRLAAAILARHLKNDPALGRMLLNDALDASEKPPGRSR